MTAVLGAICTYRRPGDLEVMLDRIESQTVRPHRLVVVDNDADPLVHELVRRHPIGRSLDVQTIEAPDNPGPAGAFALAYDHYAPTAEADDVLVIFDDDDPPPTDSLIEELLEVVDDAFADPHVAGVGLRGGILDRRTGFVERRPTSPCRRIEDADHLHGGWFPCYRFGALAAVGQFDPSYFWGFEELELGRRLTAAGFRLGVAAQLYFSVAEPRPDRRLRSGLPSRSWRHFYRHRNLIRVLRRDRAWTALAVTIGARLIAKPIVALPRSPRLAGWHLRTNAAALRAGLRTSAPPKHRRYQPG